jgi:2-methylcitrate dehydratase PrpD
MTPISAQIADWVAGLRFEHIPQAVVAKAKVHLLDSLGVGLAASTFDFAPRSERALDWLSGGQGGESTVLNSSTRRSLRDAVFHNGALIHGIDFDDNYLLGGVHSSASIVPVALGAGEMQGSSGRDVLVAYIIGLEIAARLARAPKNHAMVRAGFHPTGVFCTLANALTVGRLLNLTPSELTVAQGFAGTMAAGSLQFIVNGDGSKRFHPGWAGVGGITAAALSRQGLNSPDQVYEGDFGLYKSHLQPDDHVDLGSITSNLGSEWLAADMALKPYPACHYIHAFIDCALELIAEHELVLRDIETIECRIAQQQARVVLEPLERKRRPRTSYEAQFSVPYVVAATFVNKHFGLAQLTAQALEDRDIAELAAKVTYSDDSRSLFPHSFSGGIELHLKNGQVLGSFRPHNSGSPGAPLSDTEVRAKFAANIALLGGISKVALLPELIDQLDSLENIRGLTRLLRP